MNGQTTRVGLIPMSTTDPGGQSVATDDVITVSELEVLVRESVMDAVIDRSDPLDEAHPETIVLVGPHARTSIKRAVLKTVKDLIGRNALLSGPLHDATKKLAEAHALAEEVWKELEEIDAFLNQQEGGPAVSGHDESSDEHQPLPEPESPTAPPEIAEEIAETEPRETRPPEDVAPAKRARSKEPGSQSSKTRTVVLTMTVNGVNIEFTDKTPAAFRAFFPEFVAAIAKGPVKPRWALELAQRHGYKASMNTLRFQLDTYLGVLRKFKDETGEAMWALPTPEVR
jgi:hypothetical protein